MDHAAQFECSTSKRRTPKVAAIQVPMFVYTAIEAIRLRDQELKTDPSEFAREAQNLGLAQVAGWVLRHPTEFARGIVHGFEPRARSVWLEPDEERLMISGWRLKAQ